MATTDLAQLKKIQLLSSLEDHELEPLLEWIRIKRFKRNETILDQEDTNRYMYAILEGKVKVVQLTEEGREIILAFHDAGEAFGEMSLIDGKTAPAEVRATTPSVIALISREQFLAILRSQEKVLDTLLQTLCSRLRTSWRTIEMLNLNNAAQRVRMFFQTLARRYGRRHDGRVLLDVKLTHQDIADMTGLTRETVTRLLDRWKKEGEVVIREDRRIEVALSLLQEDFELPA